MTVARLTDRGRIQRFLESDPYLHLYALGDLDDLHWRRTTWWGGFGSGGLEAVVLQYHPGGTPTVLALHREPAPMRALLGRLAHELPGRFHLHATPGTEAPLLHRFRVQSCGTHRKMALDDDVRGIDARLAAALTPADARLATALTPADAEELLALYERSYRNHWFDPRMLETGRYRGVRIGGRLVAAAGVHVYSPAYRVAAVGNVVTAPEYRGRGLGGLVTARLCRDLLEDGVRVGLNVAEENLPARTAYRRIGFRPVSRYREYTLQRG